MNKIVLVILVAGLVLVAGVVISVPAWASNEQGASKPLVMPQVTPQPDPTPTPAPTSADFAAFAAGLCDTGQPQFELVHELDDEWSFSWDIDDDSDNWSQIPEKYENFVSTFRIERAPYDPDRGRALEWEQVATITGDFSWTGTKDVGEWVYQVSLTGIHAEGESLQCAVPLSWDSVVLRYSEPLTMEDLYRQTQARCAGLVITALEGHGSLEYTEVYWDVGLDLAGSGGAIPFELDFLVEWKAQGEDVWTQAELIDKKRNWDHYGFQDVSVPGSATYRVAVSEIGVGDAESKHWFPCAEPLRYFEVEVETPTQEERAELLAERQILQAEVTRCAREAFTQNMSAEARPVVEKYVDVLVAKLMPSDQGNTDNSELVSYTILVCSLGQENAEPGMGYWAFLLLFDFAW